LIVAADDLEFHKLQKTAKAILSFMDFVDNLKLRTYFAKAKAFVSFAAEEDFGIIPV